MDTCARRALTSVRTQSGAVNGPLPSAIPLSRLVIALGWLNPAVRPGIDRWMLAS